MPVRALIVLFLTAVASNGSIVHIADKRIYSTCNVLTSVTFDYDSHNLECPHPEISHKSLESSFSLRCRERELFGKDEEDHSINTVYSLYFKTLHFGQSENGADFPNFVRGSGGYRFDKERIIQRTWGLYVYQKWVLYAAHEALLIRTTIDPESVSDFIEGMRSAKTISFSVAAPRSIHSQGVIGIPDGINEALDDFLDRCSQFASN